MRKYFEGWYFKHQKNNKIICIIVGFAKNSREKTCFIQVITNNETYNIDYPFSDFKYNKEKFTLSVGQNFFSKNGIVLKIDSPQLSLSGSLTYAKFTPLKYNIMGPLKNLPFMQCKHGILSMHHSIKGQLTINGKALNFDGGSGYIEKDFGTSFPCRYAWTNYSSKDMSITAAAATLPYLKLKFSGCFAVIIYNNAEFRLASYLGAKIKHMSENSLIIKQHSKQLIIEVLSKNPLPLKAPENAKMTRIIKESAMCTLQFTYIVKNKILFEKICDTASFEYSDSQL